MSILTASLSFGLLAFGLGLGLAYAAMRLKPQGNPVVEKVNDILPQTQCGQCGYAGCLPYAQAIVSGDAINKCPPGGTATINTLAHLLERDLIDLDPTCGQEKPSQVVTIREAECIGCTLCIQACPVDAIIGASKQNHTVLTDACTGCELCIEPCPVDCIDLLPAPKPLTIEDAAWPK